MKIIYKSKVRNRRPNGGVEQEVLLSVKKTFI